MSTEAPVAPVSAPVSAPAPQAAPTAPQGQSSAPVAAPSAAVEPWYKDWLKADGSLNNSALDRLPDHLKPLKGTWERAKSIEDIGQSMLHSQFLNGKKALAPLPADAPAPVLAERKQLLDSLNGVPPTPKDYGIAKPADLPDNAWSQPAADNLAAWAHENSVSPAAAAKLMATHAEIIKGQIAEQGRYEGQFWAKEQTAFETAIRADNIPNDRASALVEKGALALGLDLSNEQTKTFMKGADARLMAMRHAIAIGEDRVVTANGGNNTVQDPKQAADDIRTNPANPLHSAYWNKDGKASRTAHDSAVEKHNEYLKMDAAKNPAPVRGRR